MELTGLRPVELCRPSVKGKAREATASARLYNCQQTPRFLFRAPAVFVRASWGSGADDVKLCGVIWTSNNFTSAYHFNLLSSTTF